MTSLTNTPSHQERGHRAADRESTPRHLAVILDGNRRWAHAQGQTPLHGFRRGGEHVLDFLTWCQDIPGLTTLTLWPLSTENLHRPATEVNGILQVIVETTQAIADTRQWRVRYLGTPHRLPPQVTRTLDAAAEQTRRLDRPVINLAIAYGGRDEIVRSVKALIITHQKAGTLDHLVQRFGPDDISRHLDTAGQPDPDLVIRTAGEQRLSGFMPWQSTYAEYYFCPTPWPAFSKADLDTALTWYGHRARNYGL
ncbi:polyprenyl diphosphate synthase [Streptomyces lushanensis]|uniref:polyprenyl diphosphate synthase n=1 Tax=Streptomyces lushanensis TaxID=1434255 RepID=UPI00083002CF|nr:polyprenyl diphosphate synthase [Streptomyces lushanensis]